MKKPCYRKTVNPLTMRETFKCENCDRVYKWKKSYLCHTRNECGKAPKYSCGICSKRSKLKGNIKKHLLSVHGVTDESQLGKYIVFMSITFKCENCDRVYKWKKNYLYHIRNECGKAPQYSCGICSKRSKVKGNVKKHLFSVHGVTDKSQLEKYVIFLSNTFKCENCDRVYKWKKNYLFHTRNQCGKDPQYSCGICSRRSKLKGNIKKHLVSVHGVTDKSQLGKYVVFLSTL
ncbi:hypothetical protein WA026_023238 [Henosepilachna vigintioctopunctata]|uniref:C2H2-type domain-containing protein n=1 Tax=Henosepilachna vigintioctopunctata TaxID=420089 RepID=A0AAW1VJP7_9CUCU